MYTVDPYSVNYFFNADFSSLKDSLQQFQEGMVLDEETGFTMAALLSEKDKKEGKQRWVADPDENVVEWNLYGVKVVYHGNNSTDFPTKAKFKKVLILEFPERSVKLVGRIYVQYI